MVDGGWQFTIHGSRFGGILGDVVYKAEIPLTRIKGPLRLAHMPTEPEPVRFGTHGPIARHYGIQGEVPEPARDDDRLRHRGDRRLTARHPRGRAGGARDRGE